jgi:outer membrane protein TolC
MMARFSMKGLLTSVGRRLAAAVGLCVLCGLAGCTVGPDYVAPTMQVPDAWHQQAIEGLASGDAALQNWWTLFDDPALTGLIERAGSRNRELEVALHRVREARAIMGVSAGELVPDFNPIASYERSRISPNGFFAPLLEGQEPDQNNIYKGRLRFQLGD